MRLGPYAVTARIGVGGMGVCRATDTKLKRDVAIKVLPDSFANDADRFARLTREAQTPPQRRLSMICPRLPRPP
jgi:eukaryotic-like serine/threonine-protein kinase